MKKHPGKEGNPWKYSKKYPPSIKKGNVGSKVTQVQKGLNPGAKYLILKHPTEDNQTISKHDIRKIENKMMPSSMGIPGTGKTP